MIERAERLAASFGARAAPLDDVAARSVGGRRRPSTSAPDSSTTADAWPQLRARREAAAFVDLAVHGTSTRRSRRSTSFATTSVTRGGRRRVARGATCGIPSGRADHSPQRPTGSAGIPRRRPGDASLRARGADRSSELARVEEAAREQRAVALDGHGPDREQAPASPDGRMKEAAVTRRAGLLTWWHLWRARWGRRDMTRPAATIRGRPPPSSRRRSYDPAREPHRAASPRRAPPAVTGCFASARAVAARVIGPAGGGGAGGRGSRWQLVPSTAGDRDRTRPSRSEAAACSSRELEEARSRQDRRRRALREDMTSTDTAGLPRRIPASGDPRDALCGVSSPPRASNRHGVRAAAGAARAQAEPVGRPLRGNIDTRLHGRSAVSLPSCWQRAGSTGSASAAGSICPAGSSVMLPRRGGERLRCGCARRGASGRAADDPETRRRVEAGEAVRRRLGGSCSHRSRRTTTAHPHRPSPPRTARGSFAGRAATPARSAGSSRRGVVTEGRTIRGPAPDACRDLCADRRCATSPRAEAPTDRRAHRRLPSHNRHATIERVHLSTLLSLSRGWAGAGDGQERWVFARREALALAADGGATAG